MFAFLEWRSPIPGIVLDGTTPAVLIAKIVGALAGSLISVAYVLPRGRREAFTRLGVGFVTGLVFGSTAGMKIADFLGVLDKVSATEVTLVGAASASLCAWWTLGVLERVAERYPSTNRKSPFRRGDEKKEADLEK